MEEDKDLLLTPFKYCIALTIFTLIGLSLGEHIAHLFACPIFLDKIIFFFSFYFIFLESILSNEIENFEE